MSDNRYNDEDILGVIDFLSKNNGKKFEFDNLNIASQFYHEPPKGKWSPETLIKIEGKRFSIMALAGTQDYTGSLNVLWKDKYLHYTVHILLH